MYGNHHFGNIGDVWKHLLLCAILDAERPASFWETHAGAASYELDDAGERRYGAHRYFASSADEPVLDAAEYTRLFRAANDHDADGDSATDDSSDPHTYPGSPRLAVDLLGDEANYFFFDVDRDCLADIRRETAELEHAERVSAVPADGLSGVAAGLEAGLSDAVVHVDPFETFAGSGPAEVTPLDLFADVLAAGGTPLLWYGFVSPDDVEERWEKVREGVRDRVADADALWCGETVLEEPRDHGLSNDPSLVGSHLLCGNLDAATEERCEELGRALASVYDHDAFPEGERGGLAFSVREV